MAPPKRPDPAEIRLDRPIGGKKNGGGTFPSIRFHTITANRDKQNVTAARRRLEKTTNDTAL
ncbi:hypothetical protein NSP42_25515, partial [Salmonella enterica]|nr:hypothetical protein [Salmonella enterica]